MNKKLITAFSAGAVTASVTTFFVLGNTFLNSALNTDRLKKKGNKTLRKNTVVEELPEYTPGIRCQDPGKWSDNSANYTDVYVKEENLLLHSRLYRNKSHTYVVFHYGYTSNLTTTGPIVHMLYNHGYNVLAIEPRGHGLSQGKFTSMGWYEKDDVVRWIRYINSIDPKAKIVLYGVSMGAATVMLTLGEELPDNVICAVEDCGYSSLWDEYVYQCRTTVHCPVFVLFAADLVTRMKLGFSYFDVNCIKALKNNKKPVLFIHGTEDTFVPFEMMLKNYNATAGEKEMLVIPDAVHARCSSKDPEKYWTTFFAFIDKYLRK